MTGFFVFMPSSLFGKHQLETALVILGSSLEAVARSLQQVNVSTCRIINKVQIVHLHAFKVEAEGVFIVLLGLEVQWHLALLVAIGDGVVFVALRDVDLGIVAIMELGQCSAFVEAHDSFVEQGR